MKSSTLRAVGFCAALAAAVFVLVGCEDTNVDSHNDSHDMTTTTSSNSQQQQQGQPTSSQSQSQTQTTTTTTQPGSATVTVMNSSYYRSVQAVTVNGVSKNINQGSSAVWTYSGSFSITFNAGTGEYITQTRSDGLNYMCNIYDSSVPGTVEMSMMPQ